MIFKAFEALVMWRAHFLDADTLLLKFGVLENLMQAKPVEPITNQAVYFVMYSTSQGFVTGVYESSSTELLELYYKNDGFRGNGHDDFGNSSILIHLQTSCLLRS
jgi:hypothetical protein